MITIGEIKREVAARMRVSPLDLDSGRRTRRVARARHLAMALARRMTTHSLPAIGRHFGGRDHTTVLHAVRLMEEQCGHELDALESDLAVRSPAPEKPPAPAPAGETLAEAVAMEVARIEPALRHRLSATARVEIATEATRLAAAMMARAGPTRLTRAVAALVTAARRLEDERYGAGEAGARAALERAVTEVVDAWTRK